MAKQPNRDRVAEALAIAATWYQEVQDDYRRAHSGADAVAEERAREWQRERIRAEELAEKVASHASN